MAKRSAAEFGVKIKKVVQLVSGDKEAAEISTKASNGIQEYLGAEEEKGEALKAFNGVTNRWENEKGLNKAAMATLVKLHKMSEAKKADWLRTFLPGLEAILPDQLDMFSGAPEDSKVPSENVNPAPDASPSLQ